MSATDTPEYLEMEKKAYYLATMATVEPLKYYQEYIAHLDKMLAYIEKHYQNN